MDVFVDSEKCDGSMVSTKGISNKTNVQAQEGISIAERVFSSKVCGSLIRKMAEES